MITVGNYDMILGHGYRPLAMPITHPSIVSIGCINIFIGFTSATESIEAKNPARQPPHRSSPTT
jgi:hypothetical protein